MAVYEFPLNEKIRNYLRIENLMATIYLAAESTEPRFQIQFFEQFFTLLDLIERIDIRADVVKELDLSERNLVHWSQHPNIDSNALTHTLQAVIQQRDALKVAKKPGAELKTDSFLQSIRQRFAIPGATCSFDLPNMHFWLNQNIEQRRSDMQKWLQSVSLLHSCITLLLNFSRQQGTFVKQQAVSGFFQGDAENKYGLIRIDMLDNTEAYPTLSGNKLRFALRFMNNVDGQATPDNRDIFFKMATCK